MRDSIHHRLRRVGALALVLVLLALALVPWASAAAVSDGPLDTTVLDWNRYAAEALINGPAAPTRGLGQTPPISALHLAMTQGAVYDAVNAIDRGYQPYLQGLPRAPRAASQPAAVATAAHDVLVAVLADPRVLAVAGPDLTLGPAIVARLDAHLSTALAAAVAKDGQASVDAGIASGAAAAAAMLAERADDGRYVPLDPPLAGGTVPGEWRPTSVDSTGKPIIDPFAWLSEVEPFTLTSRSQFRTKGPNALTSAAYAKDYNEVKALGSKTGSARTPEQEALAQFYNNTNPVELHHRTFRTIAAERGLTLVEQARLFAMLDLGLADTMISCWNEKVFWGFWRPITAIREGDNDGNPRTASQADWEPLVVSPPYADHTSGFNCVTAALMHTATIYFGKDKLAFGVVKAGTGETRQYRRFTDVCADAIDVRVYHGVHFRTADVQSEGLGKDVAHWLAEHYFQER